MPEDYDDYADDTCYECGAYGDDYFINEDGELECRCSTCFMMTQDDDDWDD